MLHQVAWPGLTRPLDEMVAAPSGLWIVEHRPWQDIAVARGRVITADADVTLDVQHLDQVRVRVARDLGLAPVEAHALVVVPEEVPALRLEGVVIVGQRLVRQIIFSPGRRLTPTQLDVLARRTAKVLSHSTLDRPQAPPGVTVVPDPDPDPAPVSAPTTRRPASSPFSRLPSRTASAVPTDDRPREPRVRPEPVPATEPVPDIAMSLAAAEPDVGPAPSAAEPEPAVSVRSKPARSTPARSTPEPTLPTPAPTPDPSASDLVPAEHHDEPPPPLPTPEEMGLPPALSEPLERPQATHIDPIWPIAPPPGLWTAPEPEPELAQLVTSADTDLEQAEPDDEPDLERTRVVESSSTVPMVDDDESETGRVDHLTSQHVTPGRGLPRLVEPDPADADVWPDPAWPEPLDEPIDPTVASSGPFGLTDTEVTDDRLTDTGPTDHGLTDTEVTDDRLTDTGPTDDQLIDDRPADDRPADDGSMDDGLTDTGPIDPKMVVELITTGMADSQMIAELISAGLIDPESLLEALDAGLDRPQAAPVDEDDLGRPVEPSWTDEDNLGQPAEPASTDDGLDLPVEADEIAPQPVEVYQALDEDVELTRIRPPDRPPASQSLADARRAFFSGAGHDPVTFPQTPEDTQAPDESTGPAMRHRPHGGRSRPPTRLPVAWDDDPDLVPETPRHQVEWEEPSEVPHLDTQPRNVVLGARQPAPERRIEPRSDRRSVVAGPRPPVDHRPVEHTERPAQPVEHLSHHGTAVPPPTASPAAVPDEPVPTPTPAERRGGATPRPRAVRTGPWDLSPAQAAAVSGRFPGPVRIRGAFGTGRSVAAAYRAVHLAQTRPGPVAIVVPSAAQIEPMRRRLATAADVDVLERIIVEVPAGIAQRLLAEFGTEVNPAPESVARAWSVAQRSTGLGAAQGRSIGLLLDEVALIRGRSLTDEADYDQLRHEMPAGLRHQVWALHEAYLTELRQRNLPDEHDLVRMARAALRAGVPSELTAVVVDDANDLTLDQLLMLHETVGDGPDALTVIDDGLPGLLPVGVTLDEAGIDIAQRQVDLAHEFRLTGPAWTSLVRMLQADTGRDIMGTTDRPRLAGRLDDGEGPAYLRSQAIRLRRDRLVERVTELVGDGVPPESIALLHVEDEPEPELVAELLRAGVMVRGLDALDVPGVALGRARDARGVEFDHVLVPDARHRDVVPVGGLRWDQRQRRRLLGLALARSRETAWIAGV